LNTGTVPGGVMVICGVATCGSGDGTPVLAAGSTLTVVMPGEKYQCPSIHAPPPTG